MEELTTLHEAMVKHGMELLASGPGVITVSDVITHSTCFVIAKRHIPLLQSGQKVTSNHCHFKCVTDWH
jgi:hypothetical protein